MGVLLLAVAALLALQPGLADDDGAAPAGPGPAQGTPGDGPVHRAPAAHRPLCLHDRPQPGTDSGQRHCSTLRI